MNQLVKSNQIIVQQVKEWVEILVDWETANRYEILDTNKNKLGFIAEKHQGLLTTLGRQLLGSHRPLQIDIFDDARQRVARLSRKFFFFFSDMLIATPGDIKIGSIHRRFSIFHKKYDLCDERGKVFASVKSPFWRIWKFPILDAVGSEQGCISKKWGGVLKEVFTDADCFLVDYGSGGRWSENQKAVILATAISIDFDFFENNQKHNN